MQIEGAPPDRSFAVQVVSSTLLLDKGATISIQHLYDNRPLEGEFAAAAALGFAVPSRAGLRNIAVVKCPLDQFRELQGQSGKLTSQFVLIESHYETVAHLPVRFGAEEAADGHLARIFSIQFFDGACDIGFRFAIVNPTLGRRQPIWPNHYVLVNSKRGEYSDSHGGNSMGTGGPEISLVTSHSRFVETRRMQGSEIGGKVDAAWLEDAELYFLVGREVDRAQLSFAMDRLTIPTQQLTRHFIVINPDGTRNEYDR